MTNCPSCGDELDGHAAAVVRGEMNGGRFYRYSGSPRVPFCLDCIEDKLLDDPIDPDDVTD